jgi:hydroxyacylglutathione hydrolase
MIQRPEYTLRRISLMNVACYLVFRPGEAMLVDSGNAGSEDKILRELDRLGLEPASLKLLVLTHPHFDHAGSAARLKELTGCRIMIHRSEAPRLEAGYTDLPPGTRWKAKLLVGLGKTFARRLGRFPPASPDILVDDSMELHEYGFPGRVIHTPGHTAGSMVVFLEGGELIAGDTLMGLEDKQHFPAFAEDLPGLVESWRKIRGLNVRSIHPAHGKVFSRESFLAEYDDAIRRYGGQ